MPWSTLWVPNRNAVAGFLATLGDPLAPGTYHQPAYAATCHATACPAPAGVGQQSLSTSNAAVLSCMADALGWLQQAAAAQPGLQLQVLVTGSLYLVGDCLAGLHQQPA